MKSATVKLPFVRRERTDDDKRFTLWLTTDLWRRIRIQAAKQDTTATELINRWMEERVEQEEQKEGR